MGTIQLEQFGNLSSLPSLPSQILSVLDEVGRASTMDYNIVRMIQYDASIACRVLKVANDPLYGYHRKIGSLQQASALLGPGVIKNTILTTSLLERFAKHNYVGKIDYPRIWLHSSVTAAIAGCLGHLLRDIEADVCFTAGLIHDIGKIALAVDHPDVFIEILELAGKEKISLARAEQKVLGFCTADISAVMTKHWGFPETLVEALANCSRPEPAKITSALSAILKLAKSLTITWGYADGMETCYPHQSEEAIAVLKIENLETWKPELQEYANYVVESFEK